MASGFPSFFIPDKLLHLFLGSRESRVLGFEGLGIGVLRLWGFRILGLGFGDWGLGLRGFLVIGSFGLLSAPWASGGRLTVIRSGGA